ncbi:putative efflux protein, MATE family [Anaerosporobacter mobilis DSM 15930]|jgi:putative MATE family efflux protein|uniref:Probable multidrug resistance protein NorM n=1 Tax=Anaerosporobacter mobilis DSM 15930 TaxID=1120996 RepID=A0A1M7IBQ8_9FIRM|nr:MATE family efflux transporter [Anaerosporobacter mobilis]SHM38221.1 putative efflux protein, MATE family [Anaerosporobacter mobilis DSM 15930]
MNRDLTKGNVTKSILLFAGPMIVGNLLQQLYNVADTFIVGKYIGPEALAAVGSSFTLMTFLTSIVLGLCMGSGVVFSMLFGAGKIEKLKSSFLMSFLFIGMITVILTISVIIFTTPLLKLLQIPNEILAETISYITVIFYGIIFTFFYNYFASLLRSIGNSFIPLVFLAISALLNIILDLVFIITFDMGVAGAAWATIIAQGVSAICVTLYCYMKLEVIRLKRSDLHLDFLVLREISQYSILTCVQQSIMNFGILMIQGLVNSFGVAVMAAFSAAVKIDAFAYMPVQDFGNAFSTFIAQNHGAEKKERIQKGVRSAIKVTLLFCILVSIGVSLFARPLMSIFVKPEEVAIINIGVTYLRIESAFYCGIGFLFLLYGFYRGIGKPGVSVILTVVSLGTRVILAYLLASIPSIGLIGIWWAIPIGWILADLIGFLYYRRYRRL